ncbi:phage major capsid protein [Desulfobacter postgatei]|uniref:phage major capsid protein n=1 Tax=Desulfobacter postgatei TaxID=2293 RepID=UPI00259BF171|nr:phage major capsid protein [uncultured Desulfobacter sp.]
MSLEKTEIQAITNDWCSKQTTDIYAVDNVLLFMLMSGGKFQESLVTAGEIVDGGEKIRVPFEYARSHSGAYGATTKIPQSKKQILNAARYRWAGAYAANAIDLNDQIQNNGDAALVDLVQTKLKSIEKSVRDQMGGDIYSSAADSNSILGLGDLFNTSTSTAYGSVAEADIAKWKANAIATSEAITYKVMQTIRRTAKVGQANDKKPNLYITTDTLKDGFERTLQANVRYKNTKLVDAGFDNVLFGGAPVVADDRQTSGYMDALNLNFLSLKTHSKYQFTKPEWEYDKEQPDTLVANTRWIGQLVTSHRAAHCRHTNLAEPS